ncbi:hypothetical protein M0802_011828 [Mischocyttarus mexicanus]|nr:hypothetical protein M0802_011835 [Mischocyttarus mexicanus]KAI4487789.1 hypothetical protein M0802_011828 [Mischocyttarus mexicanus]
MISITFQTDRLFDVIYDDQECYVIAKGTFYISFNGLEWAKGRLRDCVEQRGDDRKGWLVDISNFDRKRPRARLPPPPPSPPSPSPVTIPYSLPVKNSTLRVLYGCYLTN